MKQEERNTALYQFYLLLPTVSVLASIILQAAVIFQASKTTVILAASLAVSTAVLSAVLFLKAQLLLRMTADLPTDREIPSNGVQRDQNEVPIAAEQSRSQKTILSIPYYVTKTDTVGSLFRPADRFDLLKLSIKLLASAKIKNAKKVKKEKTHLFGKGIETSMKSSKASNQEAKDVTEPEKPDQAGSEAINIPVITGLKNKFLQIFSKNIPKKESLKPVITNDLGVSDSLNKKIEIVTSADIIVEHEIPNDLRPKIPEQPKDLMNKNEQETDQCITCCNAQSNSVFLPCLHGGLCFTCAQTAFSQSSSCPLCKSHCLAASCTEVTPIPEIFRVAKVSLLPIPPKK